MKELSVRHWGCLLISGLVCAGLAQAQPVDLFDTIGPDEFLGGDPPPGVSAVYPVTVPDATVDALAVAPMQVSVEIPDQGTLIASLSYFEPREGYDLGGDPSDVTSDLSFLWRGKSGTYDVVMTVVRGKFCSSIIGPDGTYSVSKYDGSTGPNLIDVAAPPVPEEPEFDPPPATVLPTFEELLEANRRFLSPEVYKAFKTGSVLPKTIVFDVLAVFTEQARIDAGGDAANTFDDTDVRCEIYNALDNMNAAFVNSQMNVRGRVVDTQRLTGWAPTSDSEADRDALRENLTIQNWRETAQADLVSVTIRGTESALVDHCGYSYVQRPGCGDFSPIGTCDVGSAFKDYAYHWTAINCVKRYSTLAHETGHNLGAEHEPEHAQIFLPPERASFLFSFGHFADPHFRTIMSILSSSERTLNYSNPAVSINGHTTGIQHERHNARTLELLIAIVASFYNPSPNHIFGDSFEYGDLSAWSSVAKLTP